MSIIATGWLDWLLVSLFTARCWAFPYATSFL